MINPIRNNPFKTREDLQRAVRDLVAPLDAHTSAGGAWVIPGTAAADYAEAGAGLEGFARRLWGLAPLAAGGGEWNGWTRVREGLVNGTNPDHPEYWGDAEEGDVRLVEMASLGVGLALAKSELWDPLSPAEKDRVERYMQFANRCPMIPNNWQYFCVLGNLGLSAIGRTSDSAKVKASLDRIETMYLGDGWYTDGLTRQRDYYIPFGMHFYALLYSAQKNVDPKFVADARERATVFAKHFAHWFTAEGSSLPFGRSLTYRFAQASFWGALAYANVEALPWGVIKGIVLRHLRWWAKQPIFTETGALSIGYAYPNLIMAEQYNAPGSPYWALKTFLPIALPADHPFWLAEELPMPKLDAMSIQPHAGMVICRDNEDDHVVALATGQWQDKWPMRHQEQKYSKFAYSTQFGFCVDVGQIWQDNMLIFSEDGRHWRGRFRCEDHRIEKTGELFSRWSPMEGIEVETWIKPRGRWHVRTHRIRTNRKVQTVEAGFAINVGPGDFRQARDSVTTDHAVLAHGPSGSAGIVDLSKNRQPAIPSRVEPNTNLLYPRVIAPILRQTIEPGEYSFSAAILGTVSKRRFGEEWTRCPRD